MTVVSSCSCLWPIHCSQVLSWEWRCSWSSANRRCSNYIWVNNNFIANSGATYIRGLTVILYIKLTRSWTCNAATESDITGGTPSVSADGVLPKSSAREASVGLVSGEILAGVWMVSRDSDMGMRVLEGLPSFIKAWTMQSLWGK